MATEFLWNPSRILTRIPVEDLESNNSDDLGILQELQLRMVHKYDYLLLRIWGWRRWMQRRCWWGSQCRNQHWVSPDVGSVEVRTHCWDQNCQIISIQHLKLLHDRGTYLIQYGWRQCQGREWWWHCPHRHPWQSWDRQTIRCHTLLDLNSYSKFTHCQLIVQS